MVLGEKKKFREVFIEFYRSVRVPFIGISVIYLIGISAIIRANFLYIDDLGRNFLGYCRWEPFSRYVSNYLAMLMNGSVELNDFSPLSQIVAVLFMALASVIILYLFKNEGHIRWILAISVIPFALNPYFLECFSYKFDAPLMAFSVLASVIPFLFLGFHWAIYFGVSAGCIILMCTTYQASSGIYPMIVAFLLVRWWNQRKNNKDLLKFLLTSIGAYLAGSLVFRLFIMQPFDRYVSSSTFPLKEMIPGVLKNYKAFYRLVMSDSKHLWLYLLAGITVCFFISTVLNSKRNKILALLSGVIVLIIGSVFAIGLYVVLCEPLTAPRAMYGVGVLTALLCVSVCGTKRMIPGQILCLFLCWCFVSLSFTYGNALGEQKRYTDYRIQMVLAELQDAEPMLNDNTKIIQLEGGIGMSPIVQRVIATYPVIDRLVPETFEGGAWKWSKFYFLNYFGLRNIKEDTSVDLRTMDLPVLSDSIYQTIRGDEQHILITLYGE